MKKLWLIVSLISLFSTSVWAQKITVVTEEYPPYNFLDANRKITGAGTEVVEEVLKRAKIEYQLNLYTWARTYQLAQDEANVLIYSLGRNEKRENLFKWVGVILPYNFYLYKLATRTDIKITDLAGAKALRVGSVRDDVRTQYLEKEGFKLDIVLDESTNVRKLMGGRIDLLPIDEWGQIAVYKREGLDPNLAVKTVKIEALSEGIYIAFSKKTSDDIVNRCKKALEEMHKDGSIEKIKAKYFKK